MLNFYLFPKQIENFTQKDISGFGVEYQCEKMTVGLFYDPLLFEYRLCIYMNKKRKKELISCSDEEDGIRKLKSSILKYRLQSELS